MYKSWSILVLAAAVTLTAAAAPAVAQNQTRTYMAQGRSAVATFDSVDASGCIMTSVFVCAAQGTWFDPSTGRTSTQDVRILISQYDLSRGQLVRCLVSDWPSAAADVQIDPELHSASAVGTVPMYDTYTWDVVNVDVALTWSGTGNTTQDARTVEDRAPGYHVTSHGSGLLREATASGAISDGMTNYTPMLATFAYMDRDATRYYVVTLGSLVEIFPSETASAVATFESTDPSGCLLTAVWVSLEDGFTVDSLGAPHLNGVSVAISRFDACTGTLLMSAFGGESDVAIQIDKRLDSASLVVTVLMFDTPTWDYFPVDIAITWSGIGQINHDVSNSREEGPNYVTISHWSGWWRDATASGAITEGTTDYTPEASTSGQLQRETWEYHTVGKK